MKGFTSNKNYINELIKFLIDDERTKAKILVTEDRDGNKFFEAFVKVRFNSPRTGKPMLCVYGAPRHREIPEEYIFMGVWLKNKQKLVVCNPDRCGLLCLWDPNYFIPTLNENPAYEKALSQQKDAIRAKLKNEISFADREGNEYRWGRAIVSRIITGEAGYPATALNDSFRVFEEKYRKYDNLNRLWVVVEPKELAAEVAEEYLNREKETAIRALTHELEYSQELTRYLRDVPKVIKCAREIYHAIPDGAKTVNVTINVGNDQLSGKITANSMLVGEPKYYTFGITPAPVREEWEDALGDCVFRADQVKEIRYKGKIIYQKKEENA